MSVSDYIGIIGIIVGIVGIVVGVIGWNSLSVAVKIKNLASNNKDSTIQQAQIININNNSEMDKYAIIKLSKETTQQELGEIFKRIVNIEDSISTNPKIYYGKDEPTGMKNGDIWLQDLGEIDIATPTIKPLKRR